MQPEVYEFLNKFFKAVDYRELTDSESSKSQLFDIKGSKVNIHYDRLKTKDDDYWFGISKNILKDVDFFIFLCNEIQNYYVIPQNDLRAMMGSVKGSDSNPDALTFHIKLKENLLRLSRYAEKDIRKYFRSLDYINGPKTILQIGNIKKYFKRGKCAKSNFLHKQPKD